LNLNPQTPLNHSTTQPLNIPPSSLPPSPYTFRFTPGELRIFRPREKLTVSQWAERYRIVTEGTARGRWTNTRTPYLTEPMNSWNDPNIQEIFLCFAPQTGKTSFVFNCLGYAIDQDPGPCMYVMPDEKVARRISRRRIIPFFRTTPRVADLLSDRADDTTTFSVKFKNGMDFMMAFAGSPAELASEAVRYLVLDETDKFPQYAGREADPLSLAKVRTNTFTHTKKILVISTPGEEPSTIYSAMKSEADDVRVLYVECPVCRHSQRMLFEQITWPESITDPRTIKHRHLAHYVCASCGMKWNDHLRDVAVRNSRWVSGVLSPENEWHPREPEYRPVTVAFILPSWYSPFVSLSDVVAEYLWGEEGLRKKISFVTQHRAEEYREVIKTKKESTLLAEHKTSLPSQIVPAGAIALVAAFDSHIWGYRFTVYAATDDSLGFTLHKIHHGHLGNLADVENLVYHARYTVESSTETMGIWRAAIDTGGNKPGVGSDDNEKTMTSEIYEFLRRQPHDGRISGIKGMSHITDNGKGIRLTTIDAFPHSNKPIPGGLELRLIDTSRFKAWLHWRFTRGAGETQRILFDADTDNDFVRELLAEEQRKKQGRMQWVKVRSNNHYLDCTVYCLALIDGEWQPSLKLMARRVKQLQSQKSQARADDEATDKTKDNSKNNKNKSRRW